VFANPVHLAEKPPARTSDRCQLTRYGFLDERIIAKALIDRFSAEILGSGRVTANPEMLPQSGIASHLPTKQQEQQTGN
jgi:hypothetical protein